jgi:hypothetical protein
MRERDSIAARRNPSDWTVGEGDRKVGLDERWIYLGPVKVPTVLLGLIPLNVQSNPNSRENTRTLGVMAAEARTRGPINQAHGDENKAIIARLERLRAQRRAAAGSGAGAGTTGGGTIPPS